MLFAVDLHEDFIDMEGIAVASVFAFQPASINGTELDAPETDRFSGYSDVSLSQEIFDITVAEIESIIEPDGVGNDIWGEPVTFIGIHRPILPISAS